MPGQEVQWVTKPDWTLRRRQSLPPPRIKPRLSNRKTVIVLYELYRREHTHTSARLQLKQYARYVVPLTETLSSESRMYLQARLLTLQTCSADYLHN
jgi:hypothetical protein